MAVPVSLLGSFIAMLAFNITLNMISLFALVMAIGIVVDDAIVVIEAVNVEISRNKLLPVEATEKAMKEISGAIYCYIFGYGFSVYTRCFYGRTRGNVLQTVLYNNGI